MNTNELIKLNNEKRKKLTEENKKYYEDMLIYIRLAFQKSEAETEELLNELLDHLLEAQADGKDFTELFGEEPKQYAKELIGELPKAMTKEKFNLFFLASISFFTTVLIFNGLFDMISYYGFGQGSEVQELYLGTSIALSVFFLLGAFVFLFVATEYIKWTTFRKLGKVRDFFYMWLIGVLSFGVFFVIIYFMPEFGPTYEMPIYVKLVGGLVLGVFAFIWYKTRGKR